SANAIATPVVSDVAAATAAPPSPTPTAMPSTSERFNDADAQPSRPGGATRSIISDNGAYAIPMPSPASAHATNAAATGTSGHSTNAMPAVPARIRARPVRTTRRPCHDRLRWFWIHDPIVQLIVAAVTAAPANVVLSWRTVVMASVTNASAPKKANVRRPRLRIVAGRPSR